jgi:protocatechuate 3,4-dioxygenase beta subunit
VPLRRRRRAVAAAALAAVAAVAVAMWIGGRTSGGVRGAATVDERRTIAIGERASAIAESGADLSWQISASGSTRVDQRAGSVLYRVEPGSDFVVHTPHGTVTTLGTTFRVEMEPPMTGKLKRAGIGAAAVAAAVVSVYAGRVLLASSEGELEIGAGESAVLEAGAAPRARAGSESPSGERPPEVSVAYGDDPAGDLRLEGQVIDDDELPVGGAVVTLSSRPPRTATTEADGSFAFDDLVPRVYTLFASGGDSVAGPVTARLTASSGPVILRVRPGTSLAAEVLAASDRDPIAGAVVTAEQITRHQARAGDDGVALMSGLAPGLYQVRAVAPGYAPASRSVHLTDVGGSAERITFALERGAAVEGVVRGPGGEPVAGASVTARPVSSSILSGGAPEEVTTAADGSWRFAALAKGSYELAARHGEHAPGPSLLETLDGRTERRGVELSLAAGARLRGRVTAASGEPAAHATVRIVGRRTVNRPEIRQVHADRRGFFAIAGLPREEVIAFAYHQLGAADPVDIDLAAKPDASVDIELRHGGVIAGVVIDSDGEPVADAQVTVRPADAFDPMARWLLAENGAAITDPGGHFELSGLAAGGYRIEAQRSSRAGHHHGGSLFGDGELVKAGDRDVRLILLEDGAITGKVVLASGEPPEAFTVSVGLGGPVPFHGTDGEFRITGVAPGTHRVNVEGPGLLGHHDTRVAVEAGETADAGTIVVGRGRTVRGRVLGPDGRPVAGATVALGPFLVGDGKRLGEAAMRAGKEAITGADGRFAIGGAGNLQLALAADHPNAGRSAVESIAAGEDDIARDLVLTAPGALEGTVSRGGEPVAAMVTAKPVGGQRAQYMIQSTADGRYRFDRLPPGEYALTAKKMEGMIVIAAGTGDRSSHATGRVAGGETTRADIEIPVGPTVQVDVRGPAGAAANALVHLVRGSVTAASAGELSRAIDSLGEGASRQAPLILMDGGSLPARFDNVEPGSYTVCALEMPSIDELGGGGGEISISGDDASARVVCQPLKVAASPEHQSAELRFEGGDPSR